MCPIVLQEVTVGGKWEEGARDLSVSSMSQSVPQNCTGGAFLVAQWLRLQASNAGDPGSIPGQGTRSHMTQLRPSTAK